MTTNSDHVLRNRTCWDRMAADYVAPGRRQWASDPSWGVWGIADAAPGPDLLSAVAGIDAVELGCGTAYVSAWLARRGARPVALDNSPEQLATARTLQREHGLGFPLLHADAERVPLADERFDLAISEYGASIWCDPYRWVPEAARLLRPGGRLVFLVNGIIHVLTAPDEEAPAGTALLRDYFGLHRMEWSDDESVEFHLGHGDWIRLLRTCRFEVLDLIELRPPDGATSRHPYVTHDWARRWPAEEIWVARRIG